MSYEKTGTLVQNSWKYKFFDISILGIGRQICMRSADTSSNRGPCYLSFLLLYLVTFQEGIIDHYCVPVMLIPVISKTSHRLFLCSNRKSAVLMILAVIDFDLNGFSSTERKSRKKIVLLQIRRTLIRNSTADRLSWCWYSISWYLFKSLMSYVFLATE